MRRLDLVSWLRIVDISHVGYEVSGFWRGILNHLRNPGFWSALLVIFVMTSASTAVAADCDECGKRLMWGSGLCAQCRLAALSEMAEPLVDALEERIEKNVEATEMDGTVHRYNPQGPHRYRGRDERRVLFVNGMRTDFDEFEESTQRLADIIGRPVTGIYSGGVTRGIASSIALQIDNWSSGTGYAQSLPDGRALVRELDRAAREEQDVILICYSRGTMLAEAVVKNHRWAGNHVTIYAFGCAVSGRFAVREYYKIVNRGDRLMRDRMVDQRNLVWGRRGTHAFGDYLDNLEHGRFDHALSLMDDVR
jgi:hypothetical protein